MKNTKETHKLSKRIIALTLSVLMAVLALSSCGSTPSEGEADSTSGENSMFIQSQKVVDSPKWLKKLDAAKDCEQLIVVAGVGKSTCYVSMHEKDADGYCQAWL